MLSKNLNVCFKLFQYSLAVPKSYSGAISEKGKQKAEKRKSNSLIDVDSKKSKDKQTECSVSVYDGPVLNGEEEVRERDQYMTVSGIPKKNSKGVLVFKDSKDFQPNLSPKEILQDGSFGGTYFRPIKSSITGLKYDKQWEELPQSWLEGLNIKRKVSSSTYDVNMNIYKVKCGGDLDMWESKGWIVKQDPYGWFQWYCRYYLGRRTSDDERQIKRWKNCAGLKGRWKNNLIGKLVKTNSPYDNKSVSPVIRQTLQHWAYRLTEDDFEDRKKVLKN